MKPKIKLVVDSGAFTAWSKNTFVDLNKYCKFLLDNDNYIYKSINLDVINQNSPEEAAKAGFANWIKMIDAGLSPIPVYHARENLKWLDAMIERTSYIGLSGTSLVSISESLAWHKLVWSYITDRTGCPIVDTHAFGDTAIASLTNFPWTSCDSATWMIQGGRAGRIKLQGKAYQFRTTSLRDTSFISNDDIGPKRTAWEDEFRALGVDPTIAMNIAGSQSEIAMIRSYLIAADLMRLRDLTASVTKYSNGNNLISKKYKLDGGKERQGPVNLCLAISPSAYYFNFPILAALKAEYMLCSYFYIDTAPKKFWQERMIPFLEDPVGYCNSDSKVKKYFVKLNEVLLKSEAVAV